jgi:hypothetical protein
MVATSERKGKRRELPPVGTPLKANYKRRSCTKRRYYTALIVEAKALPAGRAVKYHNQIFTSLSAVELKALPAGRAVKYGDQIFTSLSAAGKAVTGYPTNGWRFWDLPKTSDQ